ncbi:MAG: DUF2336 domain-containing protein [Magnetovibrionaceae bacterium]
MLKKLLKTLSGDEPIPYEESKALAAHDDPEVRAKLAERQDVRPEILYYLAADAAPEVRRVVAANPTTPDKADELLTKDGDESVRSRLIGKISALVPDMADDAQNQLSEATLTALEALAQDQADKVRAMLADALKDVAGAPPHVINRLARDRSLTVAEPVLRYSPVLTTDDLLEIIADNPIAGALSAISKREEVVEPVSDAIAGTDDIQAIADLLANPNAQIRESTLDSIVDRSVDIALWHAPLVKRPKLTNRTAVKLAKIVADDLLQSFLTRVDLPPETVDEVKAVMDRRITEDAKEEDAGEESALEEAKRMQTAGELDNQAIVDAIERRDRPLVRACTALKASLDPQMVDKIFAAKSAKGIVAVAWAADLNARIAERLQLDVAALAIRDHLDALDDQGLEWPITMDEARAELVHYADLANVKLPETLDFPDHRTASQKRKSS